MTRMGSCLARQHRQEHLHRTQATRRPVFAAAAAAAAAAADEENQQDGEESLGGVLQKEKTETKPPIQLRLGLNVGSVDSLVGPRVEVVDNRVIGDCASSHPHCRTEAKRRRNAQSDSIILPIVQHRHSPHKRIAQQNVLPLTGPLIAYRGL